MDKKVLDSLHNTVEKLQAGGVVAYPTEAVYGLGCDPFSIDAVSRLLELKNREMKQGFILIAASWQQVQTLVEPISPQALSHVFETWPGPTTWTFPATKEVPTWIRGTHNSVAIRVTNHPAARLLCEHYGGPLISTSANVHGFPPARDARTLKMIFPNKLDAILTGEVGGRQRPTEIRNAVTGEVLRAG